MDSQLFNSILETSTTTKPVVTMGEFALILATSLVLGIITTAVYKYKTHYTKEFVVTLALLPVLIAMIIFLVNGNLGTSVAVAGAFSLIRFRSANGSAKELLAIFLATAIGLATGMGFLLLATTFTLLVNLVIFFFENSPFTQLNANYRHLIMTVHQDQDYHQFFKRIEGSTIKQANLLSINYKAKKEALVLEYELVLDKELSDQQLIEVLLQASPLTLTLNRQMPKKKRL